MTFEVGKKNETSIIIKKRKGRKCVLLKFVDNVPVRLLEFLHVKPGKGSAFVRTKDKNLVNESVQERTFRAGESIVAAEVVKTEMQYTFTDGDLICFMNMETFEEQRISKKSIENILLLKEGKTTDISTSTPFPSTDSNFNRLKLSSVNMERSS